MAKRQIVTTKNKSSEEEKKKVSDDRARNTASTMTNGIWKAGNKASNITKSVASPKKSTPAPKQEPQRKQKDSVSLNLSPNSESEWRKGNSFVSGYTDRMNISRDQYDKAREDSKNYGLKGTVQSYYNTDPEAMMAMSNAANKRAVQDRDTGNTNRGAYAGAILGMQGIPSLGDPYGIAAMRQTRDREKYGTGLSSNPFKYNTDLSGLSVGAPEIGLNANIQGEVGVPNVHLNFNKPEVEDTYIPESVTKESPKGKNNTLEAIDTGYRAFGEQLGGITGAGQLASWLLGDEVGKSIVDGLRQIRAEQDYASLPIAGYKPDYSNNDELFNQHQTAAEIGQRAGKLAQYAALGAAMPEIPILGTAQKALASKLGGGAIADVLSSSAIDMIPDLAIDLPEAIDRGRKQGHEGKELVKDVVANIGENLAYNLGGNTLPYLGEIAGMAKEGLQSLFPGSQAKNFFSQIDGGIPAIKQAERIAEEQAANQASNLTDLLKQADELDAVDPLTRRLAEEQAAKGDDFNALMDEFRAKYTNVPRGKATTIKNLYGGESPTRTISGRKRIDIPQDKFDQATQILKDAEIDESLGKGKYDKAKIRKKYEELYKGKYPRSVRVNDTVLGDKDYVVDVTNKYIGKVTSDPNMSPEKMAILDNIEDVIKDSEFVGSGVSAKKKKDIIRYDYFETDVKINGKDYVVTYDVEVHPGTNKYKTHKVIDEISLKPASTVVGPEPTVREASSLSNLNVADNVPNVKPGELSSNIPNIEDGAKQLDAVKKNEIIPEGANNVPESGRLVEPMGEEKLNSYSNTTIPNKTDMTEEVIDHFAENPQIYRALKNADVKAAADEILTTKNFNDALATFNDLLNRTDPVSVPLGYNLAKQASLDGNVEMAVDIVERMASQLTKQGQFTQAAAIEMLGNNPMAAMRYIQKQVDKLNRVGAQKFGKKFNPLSLTDDEIKAFGQIDAGDKEAIDTLSEQISDRLVKELPVTKWEKFVELRKMAMLLNPKTHARNVISNLALSPIASVSDRVEGALQRGYKAINKDFEVTQSMTGGGRKLKKAIEDSKVFENNWKPLLEGTNGSKWQEFNEASELLSKRQIFNDSKVGKGLKNISVKVGDKVQNVQISDALDRMTGGRISKALESLGNADEALTGSVLENLKNFDYWLLGAVEDDPFVKKRFVNRLASYLDAQGIKSLDNLTPEQMKIFEKAQDAAWSEALQATFKDDNKIVEAMTHMKKSMGKFGEILLPFVKTPANIAARLIDYSPMGIANAVIKGIKGEGADVVINKLAKGTTGSFMTLLGWLLAKKGIITGELSQNKDKQAFEKQGGKLPYSITINGKDYTFDWMQPAAGPLVLGAALADSTKENTSTYEKVRGGIEALGNTWGELSPLQNAAKLFKSDNQGNVNYMDNLLSIAEETPLSLIPSVVGATARATDNNYRETYDKSAGTLKNVVNQGMAKLPGLSDDLPQSYTTWGDERKRADSEGFNAFQQYLFPGQRGVDQGHPQDDELLSLYDKTGSNAVFPRKADRYYTINGERVNLTNKQYSAMQKSMGQLADKLDQHLIIANSDYYNSLSDDDKAAMVGKLNGFAEAVAKMDVLGNDISKDTTYKKMYEAYAKGGIPGVVNYLKNDHALDELGSDSEGAQMAINEGKEAEYKKATSIANEYGVDKITTDEWKTYDRLGEDTFRKEMQEKGTLKAYDLPVNETTRTLYDKYGEAELPYIKQASDDITSIVNGTDKWGDDTYQGFTEKLYGIWKDYGKDGAESYAQMLKYDGNNDGKTGSTYDIIPYLEKSNIPQDERNYLIEQKYLKKDGTLGEEAQSFKDASASGVYDRAKIYAYADGMGVDKKGNANKKNGSISQSEYIAFMKGNKDYTKEQKQAYFAILWPNGKMPSFD